MVEGTKEVQDDTVANGQYVQDAVKPGILHNLFYSVIGFLTPIWMALGKTSPALKRMRVYFESIWQKLVEFYSRYQNFWGKKWSCILQLASNGWRSVLDIITLEFSIDEKPAFDYPFLIWYSKYVIVKESLLNVEKLHESVVPLIPGLQPMYPITDRKAVSIRKLCFWMNMNLAHRIYKHACHFLSNMRNFHPVSVSCTTDNTVIPETVPESVNGSESVPAPETNTVTESVPELEAAPKLESIPELKTDPELVPEPTAFTKIEAVPESVPAPEPKTAPEFVPKLEAVPGYLLELDELLESDPDAGGSNEGNNEPSAETATVVTSVTWEGIQFPVE